ncbi:MAG TPA: hypothetical protein VLX44_06745 [Xanthobacteraceae bacterium]|nr:hypothetical protein [Xanthobacteraceae bacterium]
MKTIIALLATTVLVAGATNAMAADQGSNETPGYALSQRMATGFGGAYASARVPGVTHGSTINVAPQSDFQLQGR